MKESNEVMTNGIELKVGQKWKTRNRGVVEISDDTGLNDIYPWGFVTEKGIWGSLTTDGKYWTDDKEPALLELISESGSEPGIKEKAYTLSEIEEAWLKCGWGYTNGSWETFSGHLMKDELKDELEYQQYLALKAKFEG